MNIFLDTNTPENEGHQQEKIWFFLTRLTENLSEKKRWTIIVSAEKEADFAANFPEITRKVLSPGKNRISQLWYKYVDLPRFIRKVKPGVLFYTSRKLSTIPPTRETAVKEFRLPVSGRNVQPLNWEEKNLIKKNFTGQKEFFLCEINWKETEKIRFILKAFSRFKKRQHTNMKLVILGYGDRSEKASSLMDTYKFRNELHLFDQPDSDLAAELLPAAYALIVAGVGPLHIYPADAMQCEVPVICVDEPEHKLMTENSALYFEHNNEEQLAAGMMNIFKDENLRSFMVKTASETVKKLEGDRLIEFVENTVGVQKRS